MGEEIKKESSSEREIGRSILDSMRINSKFCYYSGVSCAFTDDTKPPSRDRLQELYLNRKLLTKHAFIIQAVCILTHATKQMILQMLQFQLKMFPEKQIPIIPYQRLSIELTFLTKNGLLACSDYITEEKSVIKIYTCTNQGYLFFRNKLEANFLYDSNALFRAEHETFKRLAANSIALAMAAFHDATSSFYINGRSVYGKLPKELDGYTYASVAYQNEEKYKVFIIEPVYFRVDNSIVTDEEEMEKIKARMEKLESIAEKFDYDENISIIPVFCFENFNGFNKFVPLAKERYKEVYQRALYTSENVLYTNGYLLDKAFLRVKFVPNDKPGIWIWGKNWC